MPDQVDCYSGFVYPERPRAVRWQDRRLEIAEVLQTWRTPQGRRFRVRTEDMQTFELEYNEYEDDWRIAPIR